MSALQPEEQLESSDAATGPPALPPIQTRQVLREGVPRLLLNSLGPVGAFRRRCEAEEELGREIVDQSAIGPCFCVMEFVDYDVVERVRCEAIEVRLASQSLN